MKKLAYFLVAAICMMVVGCTDDAGAFRNFRLLDPSFTNADGEKVVFNFTSSKLHYEDGDPIYVNGALFTLENQGSQWVANSSTGAEVANVNNLFYVAYADNGSLTNFSGGDYTFYLDKVNVQPANPTVITDPHSTSTNGIIIAGASSENVVHLYPACAIIRLADNTAYTYVKVGFDANKVPYKGTLQATTSGASITAVSNYLQGVTTNNNGSFLYMIRCDDGWYVAVPIVGNSVSTTLYFEWKDGGTTTKYKTQGQVTLQKGYVYSVGNTNPTPFNVDGSTKSIFDVGTMNVRFSSGNLQYKPNTTGNDDDDYWRFAPHQFDIIGDENSHIGESNTSRWIDLFGWGTSGWSGSGRASYMFYSAFATSTDYTKYTIGGSYTNDLTDSYANADWGVYRSPAPRGIYYGDTKGTTTSWRTLTNDEWAYLLNSRDDAAIKRGLATINSIKGLILLPESWELPAGISFTPTLADFTTNNYTYAQWDALEMAGAVFLPLTGYRNGTAVSDVTMTGWYWSTTHGAYDQQCYALKIAANSTAASTGMMRYRGCAVRLVRSSRG